MKIREQINNNADRFRATTYEHDDKIVVVKKDTNNYYDDSTDERFEFSSIAEYENWKSSQEWIDLKKVLKVGIFKNVKEF